MARLIHLLSFFLAVYLLVSPLWAEPGYELIRQTMADEAKTRATAVRTRNLSWTASTSTIHYKGEFARVIDVQGEYAQTLIDDFSNPLQTANIISRCFACRRLSH